MYSCGLPNPGAVFGAGIVAIGFRIFLQREPGTGSENNHNPSLANSMVLH